MVGLLGVAVALLSMGLALIALDDNQEVTILAWIPFGFAAGSGVLFCWTWVYLSRHAAETGKKIKAVRAHIGEGLRLRSDLLGKKIQNPTEMDKAFAQWDAAAARWIEEEEPDHISDFKTAAPGIVSGPTSLDIGQRASFIVHLIDAELGALRELLSDLRARQ